MSDASPDLEAELSRVCAGCGICCQGVLFTRVGLDEDELTLAERHGLPMYGERDFSQPCPKQSVDLGCSIYEDRPRACRAYFCGLLQAIQRGERDADQQLERAARVKELLERCQGHEAELRALHADAYECIMRRERPASRVVESLLDLGELKWILRREYASRGE